MVVSSFSDLLKTLRLRAHMSQRGLAEKIGVHRNTI
jgi:DNA-binding XRE family transcriptional regulator